MQVRQRPRARSFRVLIPFIACSSFASTALGDGDALWDAHVRPLLEKRCVRCHGGAKTENELDLRSLDAILRGGERGPAVNRDAPERSLLYTVLLPDAEPSMPPGKKRLSGEEVAIVRRWVSELSGKPAGDDDWKPRTAKPAAARSPALPDGLTPRLVVDVLLERGWIERDVEPSSICDDRAFARRVYLDIAGRIPNPSELERFRKDSRSSKREALVDALLASADYATNMRDIFGVVFTDRESRSAWSRYLEWAFATNRPWIEVARDLVIARPEEDEALGAAWFLYRHRNKHQKIVENVAPALLGVQVQCAQCHDHPLAPEIEQRHYWGLVSFFSRTKNTDTKTGPALAESAIGGFIEFATLKGESIAATSVAFNDRALEETRPGKDEKERDAPEKYREASPMAKARGLPAVPKVSRRERFFELGVEGDERLERAFVNRIWAHLFGRGLVHPVDRMDSNHPPSHPELLAWLARDFRRSGYDVRRLVRELALSRGYQLDSRPARTSDDAPPAPPDSFAHASVKPISGEALARAVVIALGWADGVDPGDHAKTARRVLVDAFPELFVEDYSATLKQALFVSNNNELDALLEASPLVARLRRLESNESRVRAAIESFYGRPADAREIARAVAYLDARGERNAGAVKQLVWALLASAEMRFNS